LQVTTQALAQVWNPQYNIFFPSGGVFIVLAELFTTKAKADAALEDAIQVLEPLDLKPKKYFLEHFKDAIPSYDSKINSIFDFKRDAIKYHTLFRFLSQEALDKLSEEHGTDFNNYHSVLTTFAVVHRNRVDFLARHLSHVSSDAEEDYRQYLTLLGLKSFNVLRVPLVISSKLLIKDSLTEYFKTKYPSLTFDFDAADNRKINNILPQGLPPWCEPSKYVNFTLWESDYIGWLSYVSPNSHTYSMGPFVFPSAASKRAEEVFPKLLNILGVKAIPTEIKRLRYGASFDIKNLIQARRMINLSDPEEMLIRIPYKN
jgi:hypothetical protein